MAAAVGTCRAWRDPVCWGSISVWVVRLIGISR
jgi:hypothetical protein